MKNGTALALGVVGALAAVGAMKSRRGSRARESFDIERFVKQGVGVFYHGTTSMFSSFDPAYIRAQSNMKVGSGIYLTPDKHIALGYATGARNAVLPARVVDDLERVNPAAGKFLRLLVQRGNESRVDVPVWDEFYALAKKSYPNESDFDAVERMIGTDPNHLLDISQHVAGSRTAQRQEDSLFSLWGIGGPSGVPWYVYDYLDQLGVDSKVYRPKVYTLLVSGVRNVLVTGDGDVGRRARAQGHDAVVYTGQDVEDGVPEVVVFDPSRVRVVDVEAVIERPDEDDRSNFTLSYAKVGSVNRSRPKVR